MVVTPSFNAGWSSDFPLETPWPFIIPCFQSLSMLIDMKLTIWPLVTRLLSIPTCSSSANSGEITQVLRDECAAIRSLLTINVSHSHLSRDSPDMYIFDGDS